MIFQDLILCDQSFQSYFSSSNNSKKKCESCSVGYFKVFENGDYCYLPEEIIYSFGQNYYKNTDNIGNPIYKPCENSCSICSGESTNCLKCKENYYFLEDTTGPNICTAVTDIENMSQKYFLPRGSDTYYKCDNLIKIIVLVVSQIGI